MKRIVLAILISAVSTGILPGCIVDVIAGEIPAPEIVAPGDGVPGDKFGYNAAIHGDTSVVCSSQHIHSFLKGAVYVYGRTRGGWEFQQELRPEGASPNSGFCFSRGSLAIHDDHIAVGAYADEAVLTYKRVNGIWQLNQKIENPNGTESSDQFGFAVAMSKDWLAIGAPSRGDGVITFYQRDGDSWQYSQEWAPDDGWFNTMAGQSLAMNNDVLVSGGFRYTPTGWSYVGFLVRSGAEWFYDGVKGIDGATYIGLSLSISEDHTVAASSQEEFEGFGTGAVHVFEYVDGDWEVSAKLHPQNFEYWEGFGERVAISGDTLLASKYRDDYWEEDAGSVYVYKRFARGWGLEDIVDPPEPQASAYFGMGLAISPLSWLVAAPDGGDPAAGEAFIYDVIDWVIFEDGFESGDSVQWSFVTP